MLAMAIVVRCANFPNESVFREIQPDTKIVIEHVVKPWYTLTRIAHRTTIAIASIFN